MRICKQNLYTQDASISPSQGFARHVPRITEKEIEKLEEGRKKTGMVTIYPQVRKTRKTLKDPAHSQCTQ
jgi:hypothetical protein